jgi:hypothetical protein
MRAQTKDERKRFDLANEAYTKAWKVDGEKARERHRKAVEALHADPRNEGNVSEFLAAVEALRLNEKLVVELNEERSRVLDEIKREIELDLYTGGTTTSYTKVTFINGMKRFVPDDEVAGLKRKGLLREDSDV